MNFDRLADGLLSIFVPPIQTKRLMTYAYGVIAEADKALAEVGAPPTGSMFQMLGSEYTKQVVRIILDHRKAGAAARYIAGLIACRVLDDAQIAAGHMDYNKFINALHLRTAASPDLMAELRDGGAITTRLYGDSGNAG